MGDLLVGLETIAQGLGDEILLAAAQAPHLGQVEEVVGLGRAAEIDVELRVGLVAVTVVPETDLVEVGNVIRGLEGTDGIDEAVVDIRALDQIHVWISGEV